MKFASLVVAALSATSAVAGPVNVTDCGVIQGSDASFTNFSVIPPIAQKGVPVQFYGYGVLSSSSPALTGGSGSVAVSLDSLNLFTGKFSTCGSTQIPLPLGFGTVYVTSATCPLAPGGNFLLNFSVALPTNIPSGSFDVVVSANDQTGGLAFCADLDFTL